MNATGLVLKPGMYLVTCPDREGFRAVYIPGPTADQETWWAWADVCWRDDMEALIPAVTDKTGGLA